MPFNYKLEEQGCEIAFFPSDGFADRATRQEWGIGVGDFCYAVGLFRLMAGETSNMPIVHTGHIALIPDDDKIPVRDCLNLSSAETRHMHGFLVELSNLQGLSGSPVFVRTTINHKDVSLPNGATVTCKWPLQMVHLLGVWQGSWDAPPDEVLAVEQRRPVRVPVGMGIVVPAERILELLESPDLQAVRDEDEALWARSRAATPDADFPRPAVSSPASAPSPPAEADWYPPEEVARRRDETLRRMAAMPPKHQKDMKLGKPRGRTR
jgi:hypothetical protein